MVNSKTWRNIDKTIIRILIYQNADEPVGRRNFEASFEGDKTNHHLVGVVTK